MMQLTGSVSVEHIQKHLKARHSGVALDLESMPGRPSEYKGRCASLESADLGRIVLWWEFKVHTAGESCRLEDVLPSAADLPRVKSIIEGNAGKSRGPLDVRSAPDMAVVIVWNEQPDGILYVIDGNHRMMAQVLSGKSVNDVPAIVCVHPKVMEWAYIPRNFKTR
ncbi:MAG: hypothetical protein U0746_03090 [Gemmataceae bacterium]